MHTHVHFDVSSTRQGDSGLPHHAPQRDWAGPFSKFPFVGDGFVTGDTQSGAGQSLRAQSGLPSTKETLLLLLLLLPTCIMNSQTIVSILICCVPAKLI